MNRKKPSGGDKVGYCNPPKHSRFRKGRSGNPNGRPRGSRSLSAIAAEELERSVQTSNGERGEKMKTKQAIIRVHVIKAIKGDVRSAEFILKLVGNNDNDKDSADAASSIATSVLPEGDQKILDEYLARNQKIKKSQEGEK